MFDLARARRVMVFGAHGDDEIIGCGGTIARLANLGAEVTVVTCTKRETAYAKIEDKAGAADAAVREMAAANDVLGVKHREVLGLPNQAVTNDRDTFQRFVKLIRLYRPDVIFTHCPDDHHRDHRAVAELVDEARWKAWENLAPDWGAPHETQAVLRFEIMFDLIHKPDLIVTFSREYLDKKLEAMRTQVSQLEVLKGIARGIEGLAMLRGSLVGGEGTFFGEAFTISNFHPTRVSLV